MTDTLPRRPRLGANWRGLSLCQLVVIPSATAAVKPARIVVFLDYQNVYRRARDLFHNPLDPAYAGQVSPEALAERIVGLGLQPRVLQEVRVYRGRPDSTRDPKGYGANLRQCTRWEAGPKTTVIVRTLRYPLNWPHVRPEEKGIDVALAIDFVIMAVTGAYDVGILMSTDTDLKPALEAVTSLARGRVFPRCELAAWSAPGGHSRRLAIPAANLWCHWLNEADYRAVADTTDYNVAP